MKKKLGTFLTVLCMCLLFFGTDVRVQAAAGKTSVAVSAGTVNIGDTVKVTARATGLSGEKTVATMTGRRQQCHGYFGQLYRYLKSGGGRQL